MRFWVRLAIGATMVLVGWVFIAWQNKFHISPPLVFVCLGYLAIVTLVYNLWRTGTAVAMVDDAEARASWTKPVGARVHLEREKKMLLKAIKEAEFDHEMGKLSKVDADEMIGLYRARAIEVIKELDRLGGTAGTVREQIEREVKARLEVLARTTKASADKAPGPKKKKDKKSTATAASDAPVPSSAKVDEP